MKTKLILRVCIFTLMLAIYLPGQATILSPKAEITLLTASPGNELYSVFGHSALRVNDPVNNIDLIFNYGTFDFNTPNFYMKFVRGQLLYKLSVVPLEYFLPEYYNEGRAIYEQVLNLDQEQKQNIFNFLLINQRPENAYYHYDFFYDNCATRIRDLVDHILEPQWFEYPGILPQSLAEVRSLLNYEFVYEPDLETGRSLRDMLQPFLVNIPWSTFGIDLALGLPADKIATPWDFMYLPDEMLIAFTLATHKDGRPLVSEHRVLLQHTAPEIPASIFSPILIFWAVFILALISFVHPKFSRIYDLTFFTLLGITGLVIIFLWFLTDHITTKGNLNLLWALPTHLYYIWVSKYSKVRSAGVLYFRLIFALSFLIITLWPFIPQDFHTAFFPLVLTIWVKAAPYALHIPVLDKHLNKDKP